MIELAISATDFGAIRDSLVGGGAEGCAVLLATGTTRPDGTMRLLTREVQFPASSDYTRRGYLEAELSPAFVAVMTKRARREASALVFVHSHPGSERPSFSRVDTEGEQHLAAFLAHRHPGPMHSALVVSAGGVCARRLGTEECIRVVSIGSSRRIVFDPADAAVSSSDMFDRQVRAIGLEGQRALQKLRIGIVGLGGTGSLVAQQLAHLGVRDFVLIDPDVIEFTNLNRVAGAVPTDVGIPKVDVAGRLIHSVARDASVVRIQDDIIRVRIARELLNTDLFFGCTDSHGSRAVMQQVAYQYMIPCIDMGTTIAVDDDRLTHVYGRAQLLAPGLACFACDGLLNANEVRRDMMTAFERQSDPYLQGAREPAPAVISINGTTASLAITMFLSITCGVPAPARHLLYNALASVLHTIRAEPRPDCYICSRNGAFARGDAWPLNARID